MTLPLESNTWNIGYLWPKLCLNVHVVAGVVWFNTAYAPSESELFPPPAPAFNANAAVNAYDALNTFIEDVCDVNTTLDVNVLRELTEPDNVVMEPVMVSILLFKDDDNVVVLMFNSLT